NGVIPTGVAVESGQADLFLSGYLGIDFRTRGLAVYRLLDAVVSFHRGLPGPGATIRYDIRIDEFFRQGDTHLFRFRFDGTIDGVPHSDPAGGRYALGLIRAEADIHPDDWFLTCHFVDDPVMPGTLMYECCLHTLRVALLRLGWVGDKSAVVCEPLPGRASRL